MSHRWSRVHYVLYLCHQSDVYFAVAFFFFFLHNHQYNANDNGAMEHYFWNISHKFANLQAHNLLAKKKSCKIYFICSTNSMDVRFTRKTLELKFEWRTTIELCFQEWLSWILFNGKNFLDFYETGQLSIW